MSKMDFRLWAAGNMCFFVAFMWWCMDSKLGMLINIVMAISFMVVCMLRSVRSGEDGK